MLDLLVHFAHVARPESSCACLRHHPHDDEIEFHVETDELTAAWREALARLDACEIVTAGMAYLAPGSVGIKCAPLALANAVRRSLLTRLETLAFVEVDIAVNSSAYEDEVVAVRFGGLRISAPPGTRRCRATVCAMGRDLLGEDVTFDEEGVRVVDAFAKTPVVELNKGESFVAQLVCSIGTPLAGHAKFDSVAAPTYVPEVRLARNPTRAERAALAPLFVVDKQRAVRARDPVMPVRVEALRERAPDLPLVAATSATVGAESLGARAASAHAHDAMRALRVEMALIVRMITAFDTDAQPEACVHWGGAVAPGAAPSK